MPTTSVRAARAAAPLLAALAAAVFAGPAPAQSPTAQGIAVPAYFYPDCSVNPACLFDQLAAGAPAVALAVVNPASGPGKKRDSNYVAEVKRLQSRGITVIGYVATGYGRKKPASAKGEVDKYYTWYGVDGVFFDEAANTCNKVSYYQGLSAHVKSKAGKAVTVLNPGTTTPECYAAASDVLVNFEDDYAHYLEWQPAGWETGYPRSKFWHLVIGATEAQLPNAMSLSKARHAGLVYVTPDNLPNPWDSLPAGSYWQSELAIAPQ